MKGPSFDEIKDRLLDDIEKLAAELVPDGVKNGDYWIGRSPLRVDNHAGSFWIRIAGRARGAWKDEASGATSDIINLIRQVKRHDTLAETRKWCMRRVGLSDGPADAPPSPEEMKRREAERAAEQQRRAKEEAAALADRSKRAFGSWLKAEKLTPRTFPGSLVDRYLREARGIDLVRGLIARGRPLPGCTRFFPALDYKTDAGELIALPCIANLMTGPAGTGQALHLTWLKPDGSGKAELPDPDDNPARKIWGPPNGAVMRLAKGAGDLTPEDAGRQGMQGPVAAAEGYEDGLALMLALPDYRVWSAGTLGNLGNMPALPCVDRFVVAADNDWTKPDAMAAFDKAMVKLKSQGVPVKVARAPRGKDMNDLLKGETI